MVENNQEYELGWDAKIEKEGVDFVLLEAGEYMFTVNSFERARYTPARADSKLPACNKAILNITVHGGEQGDATISHNLFLHSSVEGLLSAFFISIGLKKKGEPLVMNWNDIFGKTGKAKVIVHDYKNKNGEERQINRIDYFLEPEGYQSSAAATSTPTMTPGQF
ncbi:DUF669 domain-containing protein [Listeria sp. ILCC792]|uniref:DUF669 domain-containing protein n=1 Tax=Listeria sp. ILCC792 TaxID=1918331 RepID=UPI0015D08BE6|nr:DUF669 domain-containing protein [Listeria sp. ILCC792]